MRFLWFPLTLVVCLAAGWFVYQDSLQQKTVVGEKPATLESITVGVTTMRKQNLEEKAELVGSLEASTEVGIRARISGYITRLPYDVGDYVEADQIVVELDDHSLRETVNRSQAALQVAEAQLKAQQASVGQAEKDVERQAELQKAGASTKQGRESAEAALEIAKAKAELEKAHVSQAKFALRSSELALGQTRVKMPTAGYVAERNYDVGDLAAPDVNVLRIVKLDTVRTVVHIVEKDYEKICIGQKAVIGVDAFPDRLFSGTVIRKSPVLDPDTRTAVAQIEIPNPDARLKPGMHARVGIVFEKRPQADVLPIAALLDDKGSPALFVVDGEPPQTRKLEVKTGLRTDAFVQILGGLKMQDRVVTLGSRLVRHGQAVTPVDVPWPEKLGSDEPAKPTPKHIPSPTPPSASAGQ